MSNLPPLRRAIFSTLVERLAEPPARLQILSERSTSSSPAATS
ncbi:MAG TPA: hypothetical protein VFX44_06845 [Solirubrobacterales bacterium]|nr:hypothetical protein [Solirubrobacterales bacterium]